MEVLFAGTGIHKSPFGVNVEDSPVDPSRVIAKGPGLQPGNVVGAPTHFDVFTEGGLLIFVERICCVIVFDQVELNCTGAGVGDVDVIIEDPNGQQKTIVPSIKQVAENVYRVTYTPTTNGPHNVHVMFADDTTPKSPYEVIISMRMDNFCYVFILSCERLGKLVTLFFSLQSCGCLG